MCGENVESNKIEYLEFKIENPYCKQLTQGKIYNTTFFRKNLHFHKFKRVTIKINTYKA